ncbi:MAG: N-acetyltransferase family protein [Rhodospirillales bacterium]
MTSGPGRQPSAAEEHLRAAVEVRPAVVADIPAVAAIYAHHVLTGTGSFEEDPPGEDEMRGRFELVAGRGLPYLVADGGGLVRGFAYAAPFRPRSAYRFTVEDSVYVAPAMVGLGIGRLLLAGVIERCRSRGLRQMVAVIGDAGNRRSIALHAALGFRAAGSLQQVGCKFGRPLDVVFMQRALAGDPAGK